MSGLTAAYAWAATLLAVAIALVLALGVRRRTRGRRLAAVAAAAGAPPRKLRVTFVHLDLGIGGAEALVVAAALALRRRGHEVALITSHHDPSHSFAALRAPDGELAGRVRVLGDWLPRSLLGQWTRAVFTCQWGMCVGVGCSVTSAHARGGIVLTVGTAGEQTVNRCHRSPLEAAASRSARSRACSTSRSR
jgi:ABC-type sugar transport system substrate-binding protein